MDLYIITSTLTISCMEVESTHRADDAPAVVFHLLEFLLTNLSVTLSFQHPATQQPAFTSLKFVFKEHLIHAKIRVAEKFIVNDIPNFVCDSMHLLRVSEEVIQYFPVQPVSPGWLSAIFGVAGGDVGGLASNTGRIPESRWAALYRVERTAPQEPRKFQDLRARCVQSPPFVRPYQVACQNNLVARPIDSFVPHAANCRQNQVER